MASLPPSPRDLARAPNAATSGFQLAAPGRRGSSGPRNLPSKARKSLAGRGHKGQGHLQPQAKGAGSGAPSVSPVLVLGHAVRREAETGDWAHVSWRRRVDLLQPQCTSELLLEAGSPWPQVQG